MKTTATHLNRTHAHKDNRVYLLFGQEPMLIEQSLKFIRHSAKSYQFNERMRFDIDRFFDWYLLFAELQTQSLFSSKRLIECHLSYTKDMIKHLPALLKKLDQDVILVLIVDSLTPAQKKSKWFGQIDKQGVSIAHYPLKPREAITWLNQKAQDLNLELSQKVVQALLYNNEGNLLAMWQELQKLALTYAKGKIQETDYLAHIEQQSHYQPFHLINSALLGDAKQMLKIYHQLLEEGIEVLYIINVLLKELKILNQISLQAKTGNLTQIIGEYRFFGDKTQLIHLTIKRHNSRALQKMLLTIGHLERSSKGQGYYQNKTIWHGLLTLLLHLSGRTIWTP